MISRETIEEFQTVIEKEYGRTITLNEAESMLRDATKYFDLLTKIAHKSNWSSKFGFLELKDMREGFIENRDMLLV